MTWWFFPLWFIFLFCNMPIAFSLAVVSTIYLLSQGIDPYLIVQKMVSAPNSFPLLAVPFFIFAGNIMNCSGITNRIFRFAKSLVGRIPGGLGHVNIVASMIFSGMSGSAVADASGLGVMEIDAMVKEDYDPGFSSAITAASATIGPIVPPSIPMVLFGVLSGASVGKLFLGGLIPGVMMGLGLMIVTYFIGRKNNYKVKEPFRLSKLLVDLKESIWALFTPAIIMGGIILGFFTPTEAAIVTVAYAMLISAVVYKGLNWKAIKGAIVDTIEFTANILILVAGAKLFGWVLTISNIPQRVTVGLLSVTTNTHLMMFIIAGFVLFLGMFMDDIPIMMILIPILMPIINSVGISPVHLGVVFVLVAMIGLITPPFAVNIMIVSKIAKIPFSKTLVSILPFLAILIVVAIITIISPKLICFLPNLM